MSFHIQCLQFDFAHQLIKIYQQKKDTNTNSKTDENTNNKTKKIQPGQR